MKQLDKKIKHSRTPAFYQLIGIQKVMNFNILNKIQKLANL